MYKRVFEGKKAAIFDLDGTILNSEPLWAAAFIKSVENISPEAVEDAQELADLAGVNDSEKWDYLIQRGSLVTQSSISDLVKGTNKEFLKIINENEPDVIEGFWELAAELKVEKNYKLGLTTNTSREIFQILAEIIGFGETFDAIICGDEVSRPKPNPQIYNQILRKLGVGAKQALAFEDSLAGANASTQAKIETIVIWDGSISQKDYPKGVIGFLDNFTPLIGSMDYTLPELIQKHAQEIIDGRKDNPIIDNKSIEK